MRTGARNILPNPKWDFAIGTTSRVPGRPNYHYLIVDVDESRLQTLPELLRQLGAKTIILQGTPSGGWHVYTNIIYSWRQLFHFMPTYADQKWLSIGKRRGYLFLADKNVITMPWPVERMVLHFDRKAYNGEKRKRKTLNTRRT